MDDIERDLRAYRGKRSRELSRPRGPLRRPVVAALVAANVLMLFGFIGAAGEVAREVELTGGDAVRACEASAGLTWGKGLREVSYPGVHQVRGTRPDGRTVTCTLDFYDGPARVEDLEVAR